MNPSFLQIVGYIGLFSLGKGCGVWNHPQKNGLIQAYKETKTNLAKDIVIEAPLVV